jgi:hypothetical protein
LIFPEVGSNLTFPVNVPPVVKLECWIVVVPVPARVPNKLKLAVEVANLPPTIVSVPGVLIVVLAIFKSAPDNA